MQPTKEFIKLCHTAAAVQEVWELEIDDRYHAGYNLDGTYIVLRSKKTTEGTTAQVSEGFIKKIATFLPEASWCAERMKDKIYQVFYHSIQNLWEMVIIANPNAPIDETQVETFQHADYNTVHLLAVEFVLSGGKNDLRKLSKDSDK